MLYRFGLKKFELKDFDSLVFGQQHYGTQSFFIKNFGQYHTIPLPKFPHFEILDKQIEEPYGNSLYLQYLQSSWGYLKNPEDNTKETRCARVDEFLALYEFCKARKAITPIKVYQRPDGKFVIIDGNHRSAIALKLGIPIFAKVIPSKKHLRKISLVKGEFYRTGRLGMPYQSIYYHSDELVRGRRSDIVERIKKINNIDIVNKSIIDLGCNLGSNCYSAINFGAKSAIGVDNSPKLISAAIRMNAFFASSCEFFVHDLNFEMKNIEPADTVFCFSITSHLNNLKSLKKTIKLITKNVLYFEGHSNSNQKDYAELFNGLFKDIRLIGYNRESIDNKRHNRPFFRCEV
ncbi:MAG: methyltransferase domain-containing protein [Bacteroidetes bacterium]|nr:methyltransferase domain-containing protein [Bacteroidota bacterium]